MPNVTFDTSTRTYYRDGEPLASQDVREMVYRAVDASKERVGQAARAYSDGTINLPEFVIRLREEMKNANTAASVIANGGREQMTNSAWGSVGQVLKEQNAYLRSFERELANGLEMSANALAARAQLYPELATCTYENAVVEREKAAGVERVVWVCESDGASCDECSATAGEHPIESVPQLGSLACLGNCRCYLEMVEAA